MTLKEIEKEYRIHKHDDHIQLWSKTERGMRMATKYIWHIHKDKKRSGYYFVEGFKPTNKIEDLKLQIQQKIAGLKYDAEYFIPTFREGLTEELIIHDYMHSLGFDGGGAHDIYVLKEKDIYGFDTSNIKISFYGLSDVGGFHGDGLKDEIKISLWCGSFDYSWISAKAKRDVEEIKKTIDSLLKPLLVTKSVDYLEKANKIETYEDVDIMIQKLTGGLQLLEGDIRAHMKMQLLEMAAKL